MASFTLWGVAYLLCRQVAVKAHKRWAEWAAVALATDMQRSLEGDPALTSEQPPLAWLETVITQVSNTCSQIDSEI